MSLDTRNGYGARPPYTGPRRQPAADPKRERTIARLAVLKAAANFAAARTEVKSADVLAIADRWLAWVER